MEEIQVCDMSLHGAGGTEDQKYIWLQKNALDHHKTVFSPEKYLCHNPNTVCQKYRGKKPEKICDMIKKREKEK